MTDSEPVQAERFSLKDHLFNADKLSLLAEEIARVHPAFNLDGFIVEVVSRFPELELKQRIAWISDCVRRHLPADYREALSVIVAALPDRLDESLGDDDFGDFIYAPYSQFVAEHGCSAADLDDSLAALREITMRFSAEDAIRSFINAFPDQTLATLLTWAEDANYHVRRLCSEGTRPTLPWSRKLIVPPTWPVPILEKLYADPTRYVTRSVANHLNDISKSDAGLVIATLQRWQASDAQRKSEMAFMVRHATRTLIKAGHPDAMELWGMSAAPQITLTDITWTPQVVLGEALEFSFELTAQADAALLIDYVIRFRGKSGELSGRKVFKLKTLTLAAGEHIRVAKRHPLRANMTTRRLYPGKHEVEVQINGSAQGSWAFDVLTS